MLATRVIPTLLYRGQQLVKGKAFNSWRSVGVVEQAVRVHNARGCDELILLDVDASPSKRGPNYDLVERMSESCFMPLTVGGGVKSVADVRRLLEVGADKVAICTAALEDNLLIRRCAEKVGCQAIVAAIDFMDNSVYSHGGKNQWPLSPLEWAKMVYDFGAGEILLTCIDREGQMEGYHIRTLKDVARSVPIPVIVHGGCGSYEHMLQAVKAGASAVAAGSLFQFTDNTPRGAAEYLAEHGVEARITA
jgi:cyclase